MSGRTALIVRVVRAGFVILGAGLILAGAIMLLTGGRDLYAALGTWALDRASAASAEEWLARAQERASTSAEAPFNLGIALYRQRRFEPAVEAFSRALPRSTSELERAATLYNLASSRVGTGHLAEALESLEGALLASPGDEEARHNYVLVKRWLSTGRNDRAQAFSPPPELSKEEVERLLNQLGAVPLRTKSRRTATASGRPDW